MKKILLTLQIIIFGCFSLLAQEAASHVHDDECDHDHDHEHQHEPSIPAYHLQENSTTPDSLIQSSKPAEPISHRPKTLEKPEFKKLHEVKNWKLADLGSRIDSIAVDTLTNDFHIYSVAYKNSQANTQLGNLGAAYRTAMVSQMPVYSRFLFADNLAHQYVAPHQWRYFNTRTPYTNLYYQYGGPKRRSEESMGVIFTQNINRYWNVGFDYDLISSIGKYEAQKVDNRHFRFFSSYSGRIYEIHGSYVYNKTDHLENGGLVDDDYILKPKKYNYGQTENIPVNLYTASNRIDNNQLYVNQSLKIGNITVSRRDGESTTLPVGTAIHTLHIDRNRRVHKIDNLSRFTDPSNNFFYPNVYSDSTATRDSVYYTSIKNSVQLKFNEEANELLRFGLRVFITNEVERFRYPISPVVRGTYETPPVYINNDSTLTTTLIGGQIFKNLGESFRWNAGMRLYLQGYRTGDSELTGAISSSFKIANDTAGIFANGGLYLVSPSIFQNQYYSNHIQWNERFNQTKTLNLKGGVKIPTRRIEISLATHFINDHIYWNQFALPSQTSEYIKLIEARIYKHFSLGNFHNRSSILYQLSSHQEIVALPEWSIYSSTYYQNTLFKVLFFQLGFDTRYNTKYFAPSYLPATGQFFVQQQVKVGDYPVIDVFLNMQLKRARIFIKMDHVNQGFPSNNHFHAPGYPINPRGLRFGVSWNFYD